MTPISIHQAHVWSHQIMTETSKKAKEKDDPFDAMLFIESKDVRNVLPSIIESLNSKHTKGLDDKHNNMHYSDAIVCLTKAVKLAYDKADNPITQCINEHGHEKLKEHFEKANAIFQRAAMKGHEKTNELILSH